MKDYFDDNSIEAQSDKIITDPNKDGVVYDIPEDKKKYKKFITDSLWGILAQFTSIYSSNRLNDTLTINDVKKMSDVCQMSLMERMDTLRRAGRGDDIEVKECEFLYKALRRGWVVGDLEMLSALFEFYYSPNNLVDPDNRIAGQSFLDELTNTDIKTVASRYVLLNKMVGVVFANGVTPDVEELNRLINKSMSADLAFLEYPEDEDFLEIFKNKGKINSNQQMDKGKPAENYSMLKNMAKSNNSLSDAEKNAIRGKNDYVMDRLSDEQLEMYNIHQGHVHNNITKSTRQALKEVFGDQIYDDIDEIHKGKMEDRKVNIHHARGYNQLLKKEEVIEIDFAGSGFRENRREYLGEHGKAFTDKTISDENTITRQYGTKVKKKNSNSYFSHLRSKDTTVEFEDGTKMTKTRFSIAGPTPDLWIKPGALNVGEYSIENTRGYGRDFVADFLKPIFERWMAGEEPHDVHIDVSGHSRGGVAAGESVKLMQKWVKDYIIKNPEAKGFDEYVQYDLLLRDPVAGVGTNVFHGSNDLRECKNLNTTLFCSMAQEHTNFAFPLQYVRGAKRIIIGTTEHSVELGNIDTTQFNQVGDGKAHQAGLYDAETGEYYRRSGINELPDGVYIADDRFNLIRVTSYSQIGKVIAAVYGEETPQGRVENIHKMVRDWFLDNSLKMSFTDEKAHKKARTENTKNEDRILNHSNSRLRNVKNAILALRNLKNNKNATKEMMVKQNNVLIAACREYMEKTTIPNEGDSEYRMNLVSDVLSYTMKETNYLKLQIQKQKMPNAVIPLDEKIKKHKERLENKEGALERKIMNENVRLAKEEGILDLMESTAKTCKSIIENLKDTRKGKSNSVEYNSMMRALKIGMKLGKNTSINDFRMVLNQIQTTADVYSYTHDLLIGPITDDGIARINSARYLSSFSRYVKRMEAEKSKYLPDKQLKMKERLKTRTLHIEELKVKNDMVKLKAAENDNDMYVPEGVKIDIDQKVVEPKKPAKIKAIKK